MTAPIDQSISELHQVAEELDHKAQENGVTPPCSEAVALRIAAAALTEARVMLGEYRYDVMLPDLELRAANWLADGPATYQDAEGKHVIITA